MNVSVFICVCVLSGVVVLRLACLPWFLHPRFQIRMREARLEKYIKDYVYEKTGESVYLHLEDAITISHITKRGSITLAILWANILQHPNNYPPDSYRYNKFYDTPTAADRLLLKADDIIFTVSGSVNLSQLSSPNHRLSETKTPTIFLFLWLFVYTE